MSNVVHLDFSKNQSEYFVGETPVDCPKNKLDYLLLCKKFLEEDDYKELLCGIMDVTYYTDLEPSLQNIVKAYFTFGD